MPEPRTPLRVLLADDEAVFLMATADLLRLAGHKVDTADSGTAAQRLLDQQVYDLLISDICMPGNESLELVQAAARLPHPPMVILVTAYPSVDTARTALNQAVLGYLLKPLDLVELRRLLEKAQEVSALQASLQTSRSHLQAWVEEVQAWETAIQDMPLRWDRQTSRRVVESSLGHMAHLLQDVQRLVDRLFEAADQEQPCDVHRCPLRHGAVAVIEDAIEVLERTKHSFKSKELAQLRQRLEAALRPDDTP